MSRLQLVHKLGLRHTSAKIMPELSPSAHVASLKSLSARLEMVRHKLILRDPIHAASSAKQDKGRSPSSFRPSAKLKWKPTPVKSLPPYRQALTRISDKPPFKSVSSHTQNDIGQVPADISLTPSEPHKTQFKDASDRLNKWVVKNCPHQCSQNFTATHKYTVLNDHRNSWRHRNTLFKFPDDLLEFYQVPSNLSAHVHLMPLSSLKNNVVRVRTR